MLYWWLEERGLGAGGRGDLESGNRGSVTGKVGQDSRCDALGVTAGDAEQRQRIEREQSGQGWGQGQPEGMQVNKGERRAKGKKKARVGQQEGG